MTKRENFLTLLEQKGALLSDGAMGTLLHQQGVTSSTGFDELNLTQSEVIEKVHLAYLAAGSDILQTNTFGANRIKLTGYNLADKIADINTRGVEIARQAIRKSGIPALVAGDIGPLGVRLAPFGRVQLAEARQVYAEQITILAKAGVDLLIIETMTDLYEVVEAVSAACEVAPDLPVIASMTYTRDNRTLLGDTPAKVARRLYEAGADLVGVNCSGGPNQILNILRQMRQAVPQARFRSCPTPAGRSRWKGVSCTPPRRNISVITPWPSGRTAPAWWAVAAAPPRSTSPPCPEPCRRLARLNGTWSQLPRVRQRSQPRAGKPSHPQSWHANWRMAASSSPLRWTRRAGFPCTNCWQVPACSKKPAPT